MHVKAMLLTMAMAMVIAGCAAGPTVEAPASIAFATTRAEHDYAAAYFLRKAEEYDAEARVHARMAEAYAGRPRGDFASMADHCRALRGRFVEAAREARAMAQAHRAMGPGEPAK